MSCTCTADVLPVIPLPLRGSRSAPWLVVSTYHLSDLTTLPLPHLARVQKKYSFWRPNAEIINGRAAMVGLVALLITEWYRGGALWGV